MLIRELDPSRDSLDDMRQEIRNLLVRELEDRQVLEVEPKTDLYGIHTNVYIQINASLRAGKRHIIFMVRRERKDNTCTACCERIVEFRRVRNVDGILFLDESRVDRGLSADW